MIRGVKVEVECNRPRLVDRKSNEFRNDDFGESRHAANSRHEANGNRLDFGVNYRWIFREPSNEFVAFEHRRLIGVCHVGPRDVAIVRDQDEFVLELGKQIAGETSRVFPMGVNHGAVTIGASNKYGSALMA